MSEALAVEFNVLSQDEAAKIWKTRTKRAANFDKFLEALNSQEVGKAFDIPLAPGGGTAEYMRAVKANFNEAAKERTREVKTIVDGVERGVERVPAPVLLRWKTDSHKETRTVEKDGKKADIEIDVYTFLHGLIVATDSVRARGPRAVTEDVSALVSPTAKNGVKAGATVPLADGRTATLSKAGKWRAPVVNGASTPTPPSSLPSTTDTPPSTTNGAKTDADAINAQTETASAGGKRK